jgi:hypothetical protein
MCTLAKYTAADTRFRASAVISSMKAWYFPVVSEKSIIDFLPILLNTFLLGF